MKGLEPMGLRMEYTSEQFNNINDLDNDTETKARQTALGGNDGMR